MAVSRLAAPKAAGGLLQLRLVMLLWQPLLQAAEFVSDLGGPSVVDENRALEVKAEEFWQSVLTLAEEMKMTQHLELMAETQRIIAELPPENEYARKSLSEVVLRLQRADEAVLAQGVQSSSLASGRLGQPAGSGGFASFIMGGQNFLKTALQRFVAGSDYPERLKEHVIQRQADILPVLQGVQGTVGNVLDDTRAASKLSFDVLKYDIYKKGVPKTPQAAKDVAYKLVDAVAETRHRFMQFITGTVNGIARDAETHAEGAHITIARTYQQAASVRVEVAAASEQILNL